MNDSSLMTAPKPGGLVEFFKRPEVIQKFRSVLGNKTNAYVQSVLIACTANPDLMTCQPESILRSALRAASLELSCDPAMKQAYLVPIKGKAEFWPHYLGLYNLAMRTGKYWLINVTPVYAGQRVLQNSITGMHYLTLAGIGLIENDQVSKLLSKGYRDVTSGNTETIIGYLGYFKTTKGFEKTVYMSIDEIHQHASTFSPSYNNPKSLWNDKRHLPTMEMKTVLKELMRWADLSGDANDALRSALDVDDRAGVEWTGIDEEVQESEIEEVLQPQEAQPEILQPAGVSDKMSLEFAEGILSSDNIRYGDMATTALVNRLNGISKTKRELTEEQCLKRDAIKVILAARNDGTAKEPE